jgi:hypothetical protein
MFFTLYFLVIAPASGQTPRFKDFTNEDLSAEFKLMRIWLPEPKKDAKTGFLVRGKNPTPLIRKLTELNGQTIADLEARMRPGELSKSGFLGAKERLLKVMEADNLFVVDELGLTHQELAHHLYAMAAIAVRQFKNDHQYGKPFLYHGRKFSVGVESWFDLLGSPFGDGTASCCDVEVINLDNGQRICYSLLVPMMIDRYGFYEGKETKYRVEPSQILKVFDFVKGRRPGKERDIHEWHGKGGKKSAMLQRDVIKDQSPKRDRAHPILAAGARQEFFT